MSILLLAEGFSVVVAIAHYESPSGIVSAFASHAFQGKVECFVCKNGNGMMVDLKTKEIITDFLAHV